MKVNIGGDRLGSGAKMNVELHNYYRSTHNLSKDFKSSLAPGILYPCYTNIGLNGDKFDIDIESITRTLPTQGPLFGSFKMQIDCFVAPIRLYHGILHNNPINLGLKMKQVILPTVRLTAEGSVNNQAVTKQISSSNIWKYLGLSGIGRRVNETEQDQAITREFNATPLLAYYDIFKNYYANKQEKYFYYIKGVKDVFFKRLKGVTRNPDSPTINISPFNERVQNTTINGNSYIVISVGADAATINVTAPYFYEGDWILCNFEDTLENWNEQDARLVINAYAGHQPENSQIKNGVYSYDSGFVKPNDVGGGLSFRKQGKNTLVIFKVNQEELGFTGIDQIKYLNFTLYLQRNNPERITLAKERLESLDIAREKLLNIGLGEKFYVETLGAPYSANASADALLQDMNGLCVKTYQSDLFNNWINSDTIDGTNGIAQITTIDTSNGLSLDALNLAQKVYNMLNRIAVTGGTYEDWQDAVYTASAVRKAETPMYVGGASTEIMFEEVINNAGNEQQALGTLGGRGRQIGQNGGHIKFEIEEPSIIMCLVSLTPRITYSQGNKWYLTEIQTLDDLHKPALDGIGYQDLLIERMNWAGTTIDAGNNMKVTKYAAGKTVAWIDYMTDVDECFGDFAEEEGISYMVLNRNYNIKVNPFSPKDINIPDDITTYIDPAKFNYAFAYSARGAQNFWTEIKFNIKARRLMSAKQIPNL